MKKLYGLFLFLTLALLGLGAPLRAADSGSPYENTVGAAKDMNSAVDGFLDASKTIDKQTAGKFAEYLKNSSIWKSLSGKSQGWIAQNLGKLGPLVKKLGWIATAVDLAPSVYRMVTSFNARDRGKFKTAFRETALKSVSVVAGLAIGAVVTATLPAVVATTAATGGAALLVVAAGGAAVSLLAGKGVDKLNEALFSKSLENFADKLYNKLINNESGPDISGGSSSPKGPVKLDRLRW